jgi:hypothetical protein
MVIRQVITFEVIARSIVLLLLLLIGLFLSSSLVCSAADYAVSISVTTEKFVDVGDLVTHVFTVSNEGTCDDTYELELTLPQGWIALPIPYTIFVPAGGSSIVFLNSSVPSTAEAATYEIVLKATSSSNSAIYSQRTAYVQVRSSWGFELDWVRIPPRGQPGERLQGSFKVTNTGNSPDEYELDVTASTGWKAETMPNEFGLLPGESREVEFYVLVPSTAAAKTQYEITITVTSIKNPSLSRTLSITGRLSPPPPELVGGTLFPEWMMSVDFDIDQRANPRLKVRGWGDIEGFGYIDAGGSLTIAGIQSARAWIDTGKWSVFLDGGTIVGPFLGVSGSPLFGGHVGQLGLWRLLFTEENKGFYGVLGNNASSFRLSLGSDSARQIAFQEIDLRHDFVGPASGRFLIGRGVQTESGIVWSLGGDVELEEWEFGGSFLNVGPNYPHQPQRTELQVYLSYDGCPFPVDSSWTSITRQKGLAPDEYTLTANSVRMSAPVLSKDILSSTLSVHFATQKSDDSPRSIDELNYSFGCSVEGNTPVPWTFSASSQWLNDWASGITTTSQQVTLGGQATFGEITTIPSLWIRALHGATGTITSSGLSITLSDDNLPGSPELTFSLSGGGAGAEGQLTWVPDSDTEVVWTWEIPLCGEGFSTDISVRFPAVFPFCGPTKGRISGRVIVDENENGTWDSGEETVEGVLITANGYEAITGFDGRFVFPPSYPGVYELAIKDLPAGLVPEIVFPMEVSISAGDEPEILIPLRPQSWLRVRVFSDANQNGQRESAERGISGVRVSVKGEGFEKEITTDASGRFMMAVSPGTYQVALNAASLPERAEPTSAEILSVNAPKYGTIDVEFGVYRRPRPVVITFGPPTASFEFSPRAPVAGEEVLFSAASSEAVDANIVSYDWKLTYNETILERSGEEFAIAFANPGSWEVQLIVTDSNGLKGAVKKVVTVDKAAH